jgi:hypothetical protein
MMLALSGCSGGADTKAAEAAVSRFHQQLDARQLHEIFAASSEEMKSATSEPELSKFLGAVHDKLGKVQEAKQQGWRVNYGTGGGTAELVYQTRFEHGTGIENFVFRTGGGEPRLAGYHINSMELIEK